MTYEDIRNSIKKHEGYREEPYHCTEGHLTGGYGHKIIDGEDIPDNEWGWNLLFEKDFEKALDGARRLVNEQETHPEAFGILVEMCFQLGEFGVSKFKKMLAALEKKDYEDAGWEMKDSKWNQQTPSRCEELSYRMRNIS